ncbi:formimidoyltransferase-cyclodeaminase isoform X3 [Parus major]|uniref:formimidoyltransferase-cyclodeaminase isoform X3 n=1 Tax=Parus major TaxID=9157 RepID=UPI0014442503|nr:formimidoyltransferase-cyclodeaminase isoform X3 [Parus major]
MVIDAVAQAISRTPGCVLLDVDAGASTNRTVYTFVGSPEAVVEGALSAAHVAGQLIDMSRHSGEHPRMGALDVCPFVPVRNVSMEECVTCAHIFGQRLAAELGVPVYLYGAAARDERRKALPSIRAGEYEALPEKLAKPEWAPDFGPPAFVPRWGATVTGARTFLIAYNINLLCTKELAHRIALNIREQGRGPNQPGRLKKVQGIGWYLEEENMAQVSTNLLDFETTPLHTVYEEICRDAQELNLPVVGSQLVGLIPKKAMMDAAEFYIKKEKLFILEEEQKIRLVVNRLGLDSLSPFRPRERIIEYLVEAGEVDRGLVAKPLGAFVQAVGARSAAPGGGSVSAAAGALGAALGSMVGLMSYGKRQFEDLDPIMRKLIPPFHQAMEELVAMVDADSRAFSSYMEAMKLPKNTPEERERAVPPFRRRSAMQQGLKSAVGVPYGLAEKVSGLWPALKELARHCNLACKSDIQVGAKMLEAAVFGAYCNVMINLRDIEDEEFKRVMLQKVSELLEEAKQGLAVVLALLDKRVV